MKTKLLLFTSLLFLSLNLLSQAISVPDTNFEQALIDLGLDTNGLNGNILLSEAEAIDSLDVSSKEISSLTGIEAMVNLVNLTASNNLFTVIDVSNNTELTDLYLSDSKITAIDLSNNSKLVIVDIGRSSLTGPFDVSNLTDLETLYIQSNNEITSVDVTNNTKLKNLAISWNKINSIDVSNNLDLESFLMHNNTINTIDVSNNTKLTYLSVRNNGINTLDVTNNTLLTRLDCNGNNLTSLDISQNTLLTTLYAYENQLTSLNISNNLSLETLSVYQNNLTAIDVTQHTLLSLLWLESNQLTSIDLSNNTLIDNLAIGKNPLTSLDVSALTQARVITAEETPISSIDVSQNTNLEHLWLSDNSITTLDLSQNTKLWDLAIYNSDITILDVGNQPIKKLYAFDNSSLTKININNGFNTTVEYLDVTNNPSLTCIQVDDVTYALTNFINVDSVEIFNVNCGFDTVEFVEIPDTNFEQALIDLGLDTNGLNGNILISEAQAIDSLNIQDPIENTLLPNVTAKIETLAGIEAMTNLVSLEAGGNELTSVDLSKNINLKNLFLNDNQLINIDVSNNLALERFGVMRNQITTIDVSMLLNLVDLFVHENQITSLDVTHNKELEWLFASNNQLSTINLSHNTKLRRIDIYWNSLTAINMSMLEDLEDLRVGNNQLTHLDISNNSKLFSFSANDNNLEVLNVKNGNNSNFTYFSANNNANLTCIQVDNVSFSNENWTLIDASVSFNTDCNIPATVNIPDYNMKAALVANTTINTNEDSEIQVSEAEAFTGTLILEALDIADLTGIEAFKNITGLNANDNNLTIVDLSNNTKLSYLSIDTNQLTALDITSLANLESLYAGINQITEIDVTNNLLLKKLWLNINNLSALDISKNTELEELELDWNYDLLSIDFSNNLKLYRIHLWKTAISTIDVTQLLDLQRLYVSETNLKTIDISNNVKLYDFRSTDNPGIPTYDFSNNTALNRIDLSNSGVSDVDVSNNINLTQLLLGQNNLTTVDISKNTLLQEVYLNNNKLENIDISKNTNVTKLFLNDNVLERAYLKNGNNTAIVEFDITNNASLSCIAVDDVTFSTNNWTNIDASVNFNTDCSAEWEVYTEDENFETALLAVAGLDSNNDGVITYEEAQDFTGDLDLSGQNITSVIGLEAFTNAASINISENSITDISSLLNGEAVILSSKRTGEKRAVAVDATIKVLNVANNLIESADLSLTTSITDFDISNNNLTYLNLKNNSNGSLTTFSATGNPDLTCIQVDDVAIATANTNWQKDTTANYSTDCSSTLSNDSFLKENIVIYPNPTTSDIQISLSNSIQLQSVEIYNLMGKKLLQSKKELINVTTLSSGIYFLKISTDKGLLTQKIIKK